MQALIYFAQVLKDATLLFSRKSPTLADVIPAMDYLDEFFLPPSQLTTRPLSQSGLPSDLGNATSTNITASRTHFRPARLRYVRFIPAALCPPVLPVTLTIVGSASTRTPPRVSQADAVGT